MIMSRTSVEEEKKFNILESLTYLDLCESSPGNKVPLYAASLLKQKKVSLIQAVYTALGYEAFRQLMILTFQTINSGGLFYFEPKHGDYIKKSPGGIFMHQFKSNKSISQDVKKRVNQFLKKDEKQRRNDKKKLRCMMESLII